MAGCVCVGGWVGAMLNSLGTRSIPSCFHQEPLPATQKRLEPTGSPWERRGPELWGPGA